MRKQLLVAASLAFTMNALAEPQLKDTYQSLVDDKGNITLPEGYQRNWTYLGSYFVQNAPVEGETTSSFDVHTVYTQPGAASYYREHGSFPDGAVLLKDVNTSKTEALTTGLVRYQDAPKVTFAMVKDSKNRFANNEAWAEGWGWALFNPGEAKSQTTTWKGEGFNNCYGCHLPAKSRDWVFTQGYQAVLAK